MFHAQNNKISESKSSIKEKHKSESHRQKHVKTIGGTLLPRSLNMIVDKLQEGCL